MAAKSLKFSGTQKLNPAPFISYWGWGREGVKPPPVNILPFISHHYEGFNKAEISEIIYHMAMEYS
jgi:hypothetical protein